MAYRWPDEVQSCRRLVDWQINTKLNGSVNQLLNLAKGSGYSAASLWRLCQRVWHSGNGNGLAHR
jgi:hypothetical protein